MTAQDLHRIIRGNALRFAAHYRGPRFHALLCDPPYELAFMGKHWDARGVAHDPETWAALGSLMLPGAFGMAFASSRGWHRLACAIEDAGMVIHPSIFGWVQGQGFPKATRIDAPDFDGHRYGLQALKPALEPIIVWQVPYPKGGAVPSITATGAGALWIDGGRIAANWDTDPTRRGWQGGNTSLEYDGGSVPIHPGSKPGHQRASHPSPAGRWPANFYLSHLPGCNGTCADGCPMAAQGGKDGASRFFFAADFAAEVAERIAAADPVLYQAKAGRRERDAGLDGMPLHPGPEIGNRTIPPGTAGGYGAPRRNPHPTVKPIALARWLATLLLPPAPYAPRRILVPFAGSGSEMIGAALAGWDEVVGVEREREYVTIARARIAHHLQAVQARMEGI